MKSKIYTLAVLLTFSSSVALAQQIGTNPDPNNTTPNTQVNNQQSMQEVKSRGAMIEGENKVDPSAQMEFVRSEEGVGIQPKAPVGSSQSSSKNPQATVPRSVDGNSNQNLQTPQPPIRNNIPPTPLQAGELKMAVRGNTTVVADVNARDANKQNSFSEISVYPNPAQGLANVLTDQTTTTKMNILIVDLNGNVVKTFDYAPGANSFGIDVSTLKKGVYAVHIQEGTAPARELKLTVSR